MFNMLFKNTYFVLFLSFIDRHCNIESPDYPNGARIFEDGTVVPKK